MSASAREQNWLAPRSEHQVGCTILQPVSATEPAGGKAIQRLHEALEQLRDDIARVEMWADALDCFAKPVPDYDPLESNLNKFALPPLQPNSARTAVRKAVSEAPDEVLKTTPRSRDFQA